MAANGPSAHLAVAVSIGSTLSQQRHLSSVLPFALGIETNLLPQCKHRVTGSIAFLPFRFQRGSVPFVPIPGTCADCRRFPDDVLERSSGRWGNATNRSKVNMHADHEVKYWTHALGVTKERLLEAVRSVIRPLPLARNWRRNQRAHGMLPVVEPGPCASIL